MTMGNKNGSNQSSSNGMLPKMELLIIIIFFFSFITWAVSKCSAKQASYNHPRKEETKQPERAATDDITEQVNSDEKDSNRNNKMPIKTEKITTLYVVLDGLKLRKGPNLDSTIIKTLPLHSEVYYLNELTKFKQKINLGDRIAIEPWIKVRAYTGHEGWVYGAGVHYYKQKQLDTVVTY